jgi:hypothetical protein
MTNDDIDKLWNQAMRDAIKNGEDFTRHRFANLVANHEREECAKLCLETEPFYGVMFYNAIRARGNT